jgi:ABC-type dipeptide/oligopeptide/nickel transport system permease component
MYTFCSETRSLLAVTAMLSILIGVALGISWIAILKIKKKENRLVKSICMAMIWLGVLSLILYLLVPIFFPLLITPPGGAAPNFDPCNPQFLQYDKNCTTESEGINCTSLMY